MHIASNSPPHACFCVTFSTEMPSPNYHRTSMETFQISLLPFLLARSIPIAYRPKFQNPWNPETLGLGYSFQILVSYDLLLERQLIAKAKTVFDLFNS